MKTKISIYIVFAFLMHSNAWGAILETHGWVDHGIGWSGTHFVGSLDEMRRYDKNARNQRGQLARFDDGVFVAIPDGGPFNGHTYYALGFKREGCANGGPAYLPKNPKKFQGKTPPLNYHVKGPQGHRTWPAEPELLRTWGITEPALETCGRVPSLERELAAQDLVVQELRNGAILPKGTLFFWWVSAGGDYEIPFTMLAPLESEALIIYAKTVPKNEFEALWFEESETVSVSFRVYEMSPEAYENQWRNTY
jgi:hypothetical protein